VAVVPFGGRDGGGGGQRDALVGRAEQHVHADAACSQAFGIGLAEAGQAGAGGDLAEVEKVWTLAAGLEREITKAQHAVVQRKLDEIVLVGLHAMFPEWIASGCYDAASRASA